MSWSAHYMFLAQMKAYTTPIFADLKIKSKAARDPYDEAI